VLEEAVDATSSKSDESNSDVAGVLGSRGDVLEVICAMKTCSDV
jgi:hypothetical protein